MGHIHSNNHSRQTIVVWHLSGLGVWALCAIQVSSSYGDHLVQHEKNSYMGGSRERGPNWSQSWILYSEAVS